MNRLVAVLAQRFDNPRGIGWFEHACAAKVAAAFFAEADVQVAGPCAAVHDLAVGGDAKTLFGPFVGFKLRHNDEPFGTVWNELANFLSYQFAPGDANPEWELLVTANLRVNRRNSPFHRKFVLSRV